MSQKELFGFLISIQLFPLFAYSDDKIFKVNDIPLKVIVSQNSSIHEAPNSSSKSEPVNQFKIFFCYEHEMGDTKQKLNNDFYRVGETRVKSTGYINKNNVVEWQTMQAIGFKSRGTGDNKRQLGQFYETKKLAEDALTKKDTKAFSKEPERGVGAKLLPVLSLTEINANKIYEVAYIHSKSGASGSEKGENLGRIDLTKLSFDVVFVIDTTNSMQAAIDAVKKAVENISKELVTKVKDSKVRFGLVGYRDTISNPPKDWYISKLFCDLNEGSDHKLFLERLSNLQAAQIGSEDFPEDVFAGLSTGIKDSKWNPNAWKHIILVGDASAQTDSNKNSTKNNEKSIVLEAQPPGDGKIMERKTIHAMRIKSDDQVDSPKAELLFKQLVESDKGNGFYGAYDKENLSTFAEQIQDFILKSAKITAEVSKNTFSENKSNSDAPGLGVLLEMINSSGPSNEISFAKGFASKKDLEGREIFEEWVLVSQDELSIYVSLTALAVSGFKKLNGSKDDQNLSMKTAISNLNTAFAQVSTAPGISINEDSDPIEAAARMFHLPIKNKLQRKSLKQIAQMNEAEFSSFVKQIQTEVLSLNIISKNPSYFNSGIGKYGFVKVTDFP